MQHSARASVSLSNTRPEQRSGPADRSHRLRQWQRKASPEVTCPCIRRSICRATAMCNTQPGHRSAFPTLGQSSARGQPFQHSAKAALGPCAPSTRIRQWTSSGDKKKALSAWSHKPVELSASDPHSAHLTPRQVYHKIQLSRWGPEQPLPVQDGDRDVGHPGSILPSGGG